MELPDHISQIAQIALRDRDEFAEIQSDITKTFLDNLWENAPLEDLLAIAACQLSRIDAFKIAHSLCQNILQNDFFKVKTEAARKKHSLLTDTLAHLALPEVSHYDLALVYYELDVAASRTRDWEQRCGVEAFRYLVEACRALDGILFDFVTKMKMVGSQLDDALVNHPQLKEYKEEIHNGLKCPSPNFFRLLARQATLNRPFRNPLHQLINVILHGPEPLIVLLQEAEWTDSSLEKAWSSDTHFGSLLPLPALVAPDILLPHIPMLIKAWRPSDSELNKRVTLIFSGKTSVAAIKKSNCPATKSIVKLVKARHSIVSAYHAHSLGNLIGNDSEIAADFVKKIRENFNTRDLLFGVELYSELSQTEIANRLKTSVFR